MKKQQNSLPRFLLLVAAMVLPLLATAGDTLSVTSLTLGDDYLSLSGKVIVKGDSILGYYDNGVPLVLPDTITVDNIAIAYAGRKKDTLKIKEGDNDLLSDNQVTNNLSQKEISEANDGKELVLVSGKRYTITHGNKTWTLKYTATPPPPAEEQEENNPADEPSDKNVPLWCFIVLAIAVLLFLIVCWKGIKRLCRVIKGDKSKHTPTPPPGGDTGTGDDGGSTPPQKSKEDEILEKLDKLVTIPASLNELVRKIDRLLSQGQQDKKGGSVQQPKKVPLEEQLRDQNNNRELVNWIIGMIRSGGYTGQLSNDSSPEALCRSIAKKLCAAEKDVEEKMQDKMVVTLPSSLLGSNVDATLEKIKAAVNERKVLVQREENLTREKDDLQRRNDDLLKETTEMVERLHTAAKNLKDLHLPLLSACNANDVDQFTNSEVEFYNALQTFADTLCSFAVAEGTSPAAARKQIQEKLVTAMGDKNGAVSELCRYHAYSLLPFMRDHNRGSGVTLHAKNVTTLYTALCNIFTPFGITFDIPVLFTQSLAATNYTRGDGSSDLEFHCPNSGNNIPQGWVSISDLSDLIVDIDTVGYSVDGEQKVQTTVLTL